MRGKDYNFFMKEQFNCYCSSFHLEKIHKLLLPPKLFYFLYCFCLTVDFLVGDWMNNTAGLAFTPHVIHSGVGEVGSLLVFYYF